MIPTECSHPQSTHGPCIKTKTVNSSNVPVCDDEWEVTTGKVPSAVQVDVTPNDTKCYWLGMEVESTDNMLEYTKELLDPDDAGKGVVFTILNGEWCDVAGRNRELRVKLECPDSPRIEFEPDYHRNALNEETVTEIDTCIYELAVVNPLACPTSCVDEMNLEMFAVCGTHGICEADPYANGVDNYPNGSLRCLCDDGYQGDQCESINSEVHIINRTHKGLLAAIIICIVLLGAAIVCAAVICHYIRIKESVETQSLNAFSGNMLQDEQDANLAKRKAEAMSMDIGGNPLTGSAVQLQTVDDQLETDKRKQDKNELLDDEEEEEEDADEQEEEETAPDHEEAGNEEEEQTTTEPGGQD